MTITASTMIEEGQLISLDKAKEILGTTEPFTELSFPVGETVEFVLAEGWANDNAVIAEDSNAHQQTDSVIRIGSEELPLTRSSILEATSAIGLNKGYVEKSPVSLINPQLNYWFRTGLLGKNFKVLVIPENDRNVAAAFTKGSTTPYSNLQLLDKVQDGIEKAYGDREVLVDYKFHHDLRKTSLRLIVPEQMRQIRSARHSSGEEDNWSVGIQIQNSLIGASSVPTSISGYLFAWWCTNGCIDTHASSGNWSRRGAGNSEDVYDWARIVVDDVLGGLEHTLDKVQALTEQPITGNVGQVMREVFTQYHVPQPARQAILNEMVESSDLTHYGLMQAITQAANNADMSDNHVDDLLRIGGDLPHALAGHCDSCNRSLINN